MIYKFIKFRDNLLQDDGLILRATQRNYLNDPFEFLPPKKLIDKIKEIHKTINRDEPSYEQICNNLFQLHGVVSFTESKSNLLMWSHYADEHKGFVLGFNPQNNFFNDLIRVKYDSVIPDDILSSIDINNNDTFFQLFYIKSDEWIYEKEHIIVKELKYHDYNLIKGTIRRNNNSVYSDSTVFFAVPYDALLKIYFGCRMGEANKKEFFNELNTKAPENKFKFYEAIQTPYSFGLEFKEIDTERLIE